MSDNPQMWNFFYKCMNPSKVININKYTYHIYLEKKNKSVLKSLNIFSYIQSYGYRYMCGFEQKPILLT